MAQTPQPNSPCCCPHHKFHKQLKFLLLKFLFFDLLLIIVGAIMAIKNVGDNWIEDPTADDIFILFRDCFLLIGLISALLTAVVALALTVAYYIHNYKDLHPGKGSSKTTSKKGKK